MRFHFGTEDLTGLESFYVNHHGFEIMFHVSTMLPLQPHDVQQVPPAFTTHAPTPMLLYASQLITISCYSLLVLVSKID